MATIGQYVNNMRTAQKDIADKLGSSLQDKRSQVLVASVLVLQAVLIKVLVDKGVITDAELNAQFNVVRNAIYEDEPDITPPRPPS